MTLLLSAILSGLFQALGYLVYIQKSLRKEIEPNPSTWLMFAYGTATLTVLEWDRNASWDLLILPIVCSILSLRIAFICFRHGKIRMPEHWMDRAAFGIDLLLTAAYIWVWWSAQSSVITETTRDTLVLAFLLCSNASTIVSFIPLLRDARENPEHEHPLPWLIWTTAYCMLGYVTWLQHGWWHEFMVYPASNAFLHGLVCVFALRRFARKR